MQTFIEYQRRDLLIGAFVILSAILILSMYFVKSRLWGAGTYKVTAEFSHITGLKQGVKVRLRGYEIGSVDRVDFFPMPEDGVYFRVSLAIEKRYPILRGTTAEIQGGILGDKYITLKVPEEGTDLITVGDVIEGRIPDDFGEVLGEAKKMMGSIGKMARRIDDADMGGKFGRFVDLMARIADDVDRLSFSGTEAFHSIGSTFRGLDPKLQNAMVRLSKDLDQAGELLINADSMVVENRMEIHQSLSALNENLVRLRSLTSSIDSLATGSRKDILESINQLKQASTSLNDLAKHPWKFFTGNIK